MDYNAAALEMHAKYPGKLTVNSLFEVKDRDALSTAYTPGVAEPCRQIKANPDDVYKYTFKGRTVCWFALIWRQGSDGRQVRSV